MAPVGKESKRINQRSLNDFPPCSSLLSACRGLKEGDGQLTIATCIRPFQKGIGVWLTGPCTLVVSFPVWGVNLTCILSPRSWESKGSGISVRYILHICQLAWGSQHTLPNFQKCFTTKALLEWLPEFLQIWTKLLLFWFAVAKHSTPDLEQLALLFF